MKLSSFAYLATFGVKTILFRQKKPILGTVIVTDKCNLHCKHCSVNNITAIVHPYSQIKKEMEKTTSEYDREKLNERLGKLSGGVAVLRVGGASEVEVKEKKDRIDDALNATRAAVKEGVVAGGGTAVLYATKVVDKVNPTNQDQRVGVDIIRRALQAPIRQIAENAGVDGAVVAGKLLEGSDYNYGYNAAEDVYTDMVKAGIIDPTKVVRTALQDAASVGGLLITTEAMVTEKPVKECHCGGGAGGMPGGMPGGMGF